MSDILEAVEPVHRQDAGIRLRELLTDFARMEQAMPGSPAVHLVCPSGETDASCGLILPCSTFTTTSCWTWGETADPNNNPCLDVIIRERFHPSHCLFLHIFGLRAPIQLLVTRG